MQDNKMQDNKMQDNKMQDNKKEDNKMQDNKMQDNKMQTHQRLNGFDNLCPDLHFDYHVIYSHFCSLSTLLRTCNK